jgi:hypothetical protein
MALQSQLFRGDPKLEAAAVSDPAHIVSGASGEHVRKIQQALIQLDGATIEADGKYGPTTANAVLAYKQKRKIINLSYQTQADNVVGKMTMTALDREMLEYERARTSQGPLRLKPVSPSNGGPVYRPALAFTASQHGDTVKFAASPRAFAGPTFQPGDHIELNMGQIGRFEVLDGFGATLGSTNENVVMVAHPGQSPVHGTLPVTKNKQTFELHAKFSGSTAVVAAVKSAGGLFDFGASHLGVTVKDPRLIIFSPGVEHNHQPLSSEVDWYNKVCPNPNNRPPDDPLALKLTALAATGPTPRKVINLALDEFKKDKPNAAAHLEWYLKEGGKDFNEDNNIATWIRNDGMARRKIGRLIRAKLIASPGVDPNLGSVFGIPNLNLVVRDQFEFDREEFGNLDFRNAFGSIDKVDILADLAAGTFRVWFQDRYEFHPMYPGLFLPECKDGKPRNTNFAHAAGVQMKLEGAKDYWMKGQATLPLDVLRPFL